MASVGKEASAGWAMRWIESPLLGAALLAACLPPLEWDFLLPLALVPWLSFVAAPTLAGRWPWLRLYFAGAAYFFLVLHWLRLPHVGAAVGWVVLSLYLACYVPLWAWVSRTAVHRLSVPLAVAAPIAWMACEWLRCTLLTGFSMACLGHALYRRPLFIQTADLGGAQLVGAGVMLAGIAARWLILRGLKLPTPGETWRSPAACGVVLTAMLGYGALRLSETPVPATEKPLRVALLQGTVIEKIDMSAEERDAILPQYDRLSKAAAALHPDLIVWPEAILRHPNHAVAVADDEVWRNAPPPTAVPPADPSKEPPRFVRKDVERAADDSRRFVAGLADRYATPTLVGVGLVEVGPTSWASFNASALAAPGGTVQSWYRKVHLVMFGEYVPFADANPWLYEVLPLHGSQRSGPAEQPLMRLGDERIAVDICFESTIPTFIRSQVRRSGETPTILVNQSNDGWFHRSSEVELHLACGVFRAVECRRVFLTAANAGISAAIDPYGRVLAEAPRGAEHMQVVSVRTSIGDSGYLWWGDLLSQAAAAACLLALLAARFRSRRSDGAQRGVGPNASAGSANSGLGRLNSVAAPWSDGTLTD